MSKIPAEPAFHPSPLSLECYDLVVVGGGLVGLATAREVLLRRPGMRVGVLEKEDTIAAHQSGHNSGVIHAGIYYTPGSLKAKACVAGHRAMIEFCQEHNIPFDLCGKVIVALNESELPRLTTLYQRGVANGVQGLELIGPERLRELEPHAAGIKAIYSPHSGIADYKKVAQAYAQEVQKNGGDVVTGCEVIDMTIQNNETRVRVRQQIQGGKRENEVTARYVITCGGLHADKLSRMTETENEWRILPFRGDYYVLRPEKRSLVRALIYPVPDPRFPFLGVHFTQRPNGEVWVGPNAVLAFAREGYRRWQVHPGNMWEALTYSGFWKMVAQYWQKGTLELYQDYVKAAYVKEVQRYMPALQGEDLLPGPSGVRAQVLLKDGRLLDDFFISRGEHVVHVRNAPSPAATSSLVVAKMIVDEAERSFQWA